MKRPLWGEPIEKNWGNAFNIPVSVEKGGQSGKPSTSQSNIDTDSHDGHSDASNGQHARHENNSQSENSNESQESKEPKRFTSKIEITPVNPYEENTSSNSASNTQTDTKYQPGTPNSGRKQPQVRHIPIFVEGRSEPVVPKNTGDFHPPNQFHHEQQIPIKRKFDVPDGVPPKQEVPVQQIPVHIEKTKPKPAENPKPEPPKPAENKAPSHKPNDPMYRIAQVQQEVDNLTGDVEKYTGNSRKEKAYLYLDEMLTRNLIKLDTIEVEGNEKLRVARKDVIRSIQKAIALLESKVPLPTPSEQPDEEMKSAEDSNADPNMEVDELSQNADQNTANAGGGEK